MNVREQHQKQIIDISFRDLLKNPKSTTQDIYKFINMNLTKQTLAAMEKHRDENQRDSRPPHDYSLEQFGFSEDEINNKFMKYRATFTNLL